MPGLNQIAGNCACGVTCVTCSGSIPKTLSITDANGTYTATWSSTLSMWITGKLCAASQMPIGICSSVNSYHNYCNLGPVSGQPLYVYGISCASAGHMTLYRYWYEVTCVSPSWQYVPCGCAWNWGSQVYSSSGSVAVTCGSIAWSGTLTKITGNLFDPVSGTTSFTQ
jgi:hypothetical protein